MHHSKPHHQFSTLSNFICYFSCIYWFFGAIRPWNWKKHYKWTLKRLKVGMVSSFHPHSMFKKIERLTAKTGCTSCTKQTISFEVWGFHTETHMLQRDFIFLNLFELQTFCVFKMHHSKPHHHFFNPFWLHFLFSWPSLIILSYKTIKFKSIWNELWKGSNLAWYHHFTHIACA